MIAMVDQIREGIERRSLTVGIVGLGYVGLPLSLAFAEAGFCVTGFDVDTQKIDLLKAGQSYIRYISQDRVSNCVAAKKFKATNEFALLRDQDAILICVPTPLTKHHDPDMQFVQQTADAIARHLRPGQLVILESTTYPGTTDGLVREVLDGSGLIFGRDYFLAFSPEREDPGNATFTTQVIPKVVGGVDETSGHLAKALYETAFSKVILVESARVAEAAKLMENIFRGVNIALVNELKMTFDRMGINIWSVLDAAETKPFGFMRFNPGPGWGGHCIPVDPFYLSWCARSYGVETKFIELAGEINRRMPDYVVARLQSALNDRKKPMKDARVLLLGVAYKAGIQDCRESPAFPILHLLTNLGAEVTFHDPFVPDLPRTHEWPHLQELRSEPLTPESVAAADVVLIVTAHPGIDYEMVRSTAQLIVDTRGVYLQVEPNIVKA